MGRLLFLLSPAFAPSSISINISEIDLKPEIWDRADWVIMAPYVYLRHPSFCLGAPARYSNSAPPVDTKCGRFSLAAAGSRLSGYVRRVKENLATRLFWLEETTRCCYITGATEKSRALLAPSRQPSGGCCCMRTNCYSAATPRAPGLPVSPSVRMSETSCTRWRDSQPGIRVACSVAARVSAAPGRRRAYIGMVFVTGQS